MFHVGRERLPHKSRLPAQVLAFASFGSEFAAGGRYAGPNGGRALDILTAPVERTGELVGKNKLPEYAWPNTTVAEVNLCVYVARLRKLLGDGQTDYRYIASMIGRGYRFAASVALSPLQ